MASASNQNSEIEALVQRALSGEERAFSKLYDLYFAKIYRFIYYRVNHREAAEDLAAETFIRVWEKLGEIEEPRSFSGWLYQIARNLVIDYYRSRRPTLDLTILENILEYESKIIEQADLDFQEKALLKALNKLSPNEALVIKLKFLDELENHEIAKILNKSEGAIRVIQHRAILELKKLLQEEDE